MEIRAHDWTPGPSIEWRTAMEEYIGLDVSMKETAVSIRRAGERIWRGKCASDPSTIAELIRNRAPFVKRVVFETGPLSVWFYHSLRTEGLPAICIDARHAKAALDMAANKTDANDADGLAQLAEVGFFREVRVKGFDSMLTRTLVAARTRLVQITTELSNQIGGVMKTFGLLVPAGKGSTFEKNGGAFLPIRTDLHPSCYRCWKLGVPFASVLPNSDANWCGTPPESGLPHPHVNSRRRCDHRNFLYHSY
jgi:transposase